MLWEYLTSILHSITSVFITQPSPGLPLPEAQKLPKRPVDVFEYIVRSPGPPPRLSFGHGSELNGYPSTGGVWILYKPHPILLQHLSIDRFTAIYSERDTNPVAEDAFCNSLKKIGATWWRSFYAAEFEANSYPDRKPDHVFLEWPKNQGVWFLQLNESEFLDSQTGMLAMALDMDEYCKVLERNGATFYEDAKDCEYLKDVV